MKTQVNNMESSRKNKSAAVLAAAAALALAASAGAQIGGYQGFGNVSYGTWMPGGGATTGNIFFSPWWEFPNSIFLSQVRTGWPAGLEVQSMALTGAVLYDAPTNTAATAFMIPGVATLTQWDPWGKYPACASQANFQVDMLVGPGGLNVTSSAMQAMIVSRKGFWGASQFTYGINYFSYNTVTGASVFLGQQIFSRTPPPGMYIERVAIPAGFLGSVNIPFVAGGIGGNSQWVFRAVGAIQFAVNNEDGRVDMRMSTADENACPFVSPPLDTPVILGQPLELKVAAIGDGPLSYRWRKDGVELANGPADGGGTISGSGSDTLSIDIAGSADLGSYDVVVTSDCGTVISEPSAVEVFCHADMNRDGFVDGIDADIFNNAFDEGNLAADYNGDEFVDGIDSDEFNNDFDRGC